MIIFKINDTEYKIDSGELISNDEFDQKFFALVSEEPLEPWEGPVDLALANRMAGRKLTDEEIIKEVYEVPPDNSVY